MNRKKVKEKFSKWSCRNFYRTELYIFLGEFSHKVVKNLNFQKNKFVTIPKKAPKKSKTNKNFFTFAIEQFLKF